MRFLTPFPRFHTHRRTAWIIDHPHLENNAARNYAKDPQAINSAVNAVIAVTRADVQALAQAGRIVVR